MPLSEQEIRDRLKSLAPFHHAIDLPFGLNTYDRSAIRANRESFGRMETLRRHLWPVLLKTFGGSLAGKAVLDVACNCGGLSFLAADSGAETVLGFDSEFAYIEQANFLKQALGQHKAEFEVARLEDVTTATHGQFDIVFLFGILYHVENPIAVLKHIAGLTRDMIVVDTTLMRIPYINRFLRKPMWTMKIVTPVDDSDTTTGLWRRDRHCQFYPNKAAVIEALQFAGFDQVDYLEPTAPGLEPRYYKGKRGVFIARKVPIEPGSAGEAWSVHIAPEQRA